MGSGPRTSSHVLTSAAAVLVIYLHHAQIKQTENQHHPNMQSDARIILLHLLRLDLLPSTATTSILSPTARSGGEKTIQYSPAVFGFLQNLAFLYRFLRSGGASESRVREARRAESCMDSQGIVLVSIGSSLKILLSPPPVPLCGRSTLLNIVIIAVSMALETS